jgi:hypothetical protein
MPISEDMVNCAQYIEQVWWESGRIPTDDKVAQVVGLDVAAVRKYWKQEVFRNALKKRGVTLNLEEDDLPILSMQQMNVVAILLNTFDRRSMREKLESVQVSPQQLAAWMRDAKFSAHYRKRAERQFAEADATAYLAVIKGMEDGDLKATQLFLEMRGLYSPKVQMDVNIDNVLVRVIEAVTKHVKDPTILAAIAEELDMIPGVSMSAPQVTEAIEVSSTGVSPRPELTI